MRQNRKWLGIAAEHAEEIEQVITGKAWEPLLSLLLRKDLSDDAAQPRHAADGAARRR
jgi:hypothetical protein